MNSSSTSISSSFTTRIPCHLLLSSPPEAPISQLNPSTDHQDERIVNSHEQMNDPQPCPTKNKRGRPKKSITVSTTTPVLTRPSRNRKPTKFSTPIVPIEQELNDQSGRSQDVDESTESSDSEPTPNSTQVSNRYTVLLEKARASRAKTLEKKERIEAKVPAKSKAMMNATSLIASCKSRIANIKPAASGRNLQLQPIPPLNPRFDDMMNSPNPNEFFMDHTGETVHSFLELYRMCESSLNPRRKGRRAKIGPIDQLIVLLTYYHLYPTLTELSRITKINLSTCSDSIKHASNAIRSVFSSKLLYTPKLNELVQRVPSTENFPDALLIVDSTFLPTTRPQASFDSSRAFFSPKHGDYGLKYQVTHSRDGRAVHVSGPHAGSRHDFAIFKDESDTLKLILQDPNFEWSILMDKGYVGANSLPGITAHIPNKINSVEFENDTIESKMLAKERVLCENFYGRLKNRYAIVREQYRGSWALHKTHFENVVALTNFHTQCRPLRNSDDDAEFYRNLQVVQRDEGLQRYWTAVSKRARYYKKRKMAVTFDTNEFENDQQID